MEALEIIQIYYCKQKQFQTEMRNSYDDPNSCQLCFHTTQEQRVLMRCILKKLKNLPDYPEGLPQKTIILPSSNQGLSRLIKVMKASEQPPCRWTSPCLHMQWMRMLSRTMKIEIQKIDYKCHQVADLMAQRNYELNLLTKQAKNVADRLVKNSKQSKKRQGTVKVEEPEARQYVALELRAPERGEIKRQEEELIPTVTTIKTENNQLQLNYVPDFVPPNMGFYIGYNFYQEEKQ